MTLRYIISILLFLLVPSTHWRRLLSEREVQVNAELRAAMEKVDPTPGSRPGAYFVIRDRLASTYKGLVMRPWFGNALAAFFVVAALGQVFLFYHPQLAALGGLAVNLLF